MARALAEMGLGGVRVQGAVVCVWQSSFFDEGEDLVEIVRELRLTHIM